MEPEISPGEQPPEPENTAKSATEICEKCGYPRTPVFCRECEERAVRVRQREAVSAAIWGGARARDSFTLEAFRPTAHNQAGIQIVKTFKPLVGENLYIQGATGTGKTHLAVAAARTHTKARHKLLWKPQDVSRAVRAAQDAEGETCVIQTFIDQRILVLDDFGVEKLTAFISSVLYEVIDGRYMAGSGGLVITSNLTLDDLAERLGDDRIASRIAGMSRIIDLGAEAPDMRLEGRRRPK